MRIDVRSERDSVAKDVQIYAEYRVFSVLQRFASGIDLIIVDVNESAEGHNIPKAQCTVDVRLIVGGQIQISSTGSHAAVAIDGAVQRLVRALALKLNRPFERRAEAGVCGHNTRPKHR